MIYFSSDLHFFHDKEFIYAARGFATVEEMNDEIVRRWSETVKADDIVYLLGDEMMNDTEKGIEYLKKLNGTIHIILGNHDTSKKIEEYQKIGIDCKYADVIKYKKYHFYLSHYPTLTGNTTDKHLSTVLINLYGHTHQTNNFLTITDDDGKPLKEIISSYHVGVDSHDCRPVSIDEIIEEMKARFKMQEQSGAEGEKEEN